MALTTSIPGEGMQGKSRQGEVTVALYLPLCLILPEFLWHKYQAQSQNWHWEDNPSCGNDEAPSWPLQALWWKVAAGWAFWAFLLLEDNGL